MRFIVALVVRLHIVEVASGRTSEVDLGWERGLGGNLEVIPAGFVTLVADGVRNRLMRYTRTGQDWARAAIGGDHVANIEDFTVSRDGRTIVYARSTASTPTQVFAARLDEGAVTAAVQISDLNPRYKERTIARTEVVRWRGAGGEEVDGLLYYPHGYEEGRRYPLITAPHGGPFGADLDVWDDRVSYPNNLFAQRGAFVLRPNYHGSSNYGLAFAESICCGKYYELPVQDVETGVDALVQRGLVDPDRIGTMGWSNGAILSIGVMLANPGRYKAAAAGPATWSGYPTGPTWTSATRSTRTTSARRPSRTPNATSSCPRSSGWIESRRRRSSSSGPRIATSRPIRAGHTSVRCSTSAKCRRVSCCSPASRTASARSHTRCGSSRRRWPGSTGTSFAQRRQPTRR